MKRNKYKGLSRKEFAHYMKYLFDGAFLVMYSIFARVEAMFQSLCYQFSMQPYKMESTQHFAIFGNSSQNPGIPSLVDKALVLFVLFIMTT